MLALSLFAATAPAQTVEHSEDFESYALHVDPTGWIDTSVGQPAPEARGLYKTWPDPLAPDNVVFGTKQASGSPDGNTPRIGTFATYVEKEFASQGRLEFRGRLLRTSAASRLGVSFFSSYPEEDRYYIVGLWAGHAGALTMQLSAFGGGEPAGALDSGFTPEPGQWIRFLVQADEVGEATHIRARFWPDGSAEPDAFQIVATDASMSRPTTGRIGIWAAVRGDVYADDLHARSPVDHVPPVIAFLESGEPIVDGTVFPREVGPEVRVTDDLSPFTFSATLDGMPWTGGTISSDGPHTLAVTASDAAGNTSEATVTFTIDRSPPALALLTPPSGSCTSAATIALSGTYADPHLASIAILTGGAPIPATIDAEHGTWSAALTPPEGPLAGAIEAVDAFGHRAIQPFAILIDRTAPLIDIAIGGAPAADGLVANRPLALSAAVRDRDPTVALDLRLDGAAWATPALVSAEGAHELAATAVDCAGNQAQRTLAFTIDRTPPAFGAFTPPHGATVGEMPDSIAGEVSDDAVLVTVARNALSVEPGNGTFTLTALPFVEGLNRFLIRAADAAGNVAEIEYRVTVSTRAPSVEIVESGAPLVNGALFNREVRPAVVVSDGGAEVEVTLDGAPFVSGTAISAEGPHTLRATATDALGHATTVEVSFTIDRTPPAIAITAPQAGPVTGDSITVAGTAGDAASVTVNGVPAALAAGAFTATVPLEEGENLLIATGRDAAGNSGRAEVLVSRDTLASGIIVTSPADGTVTNRPSVRVTGRVLSPSLVQSVTIGSTAVAFDPAGNFALEAFPLSEGTNAIVATALSTTGRSTSVTVNVVADRTPPQLRILESSAPMDDEARFASAAELSLEATDERELASTEARIDGVTTAMPASVVAAGGHTIVAVAMDAAGNETRVERTFFIGGASAGGCRLEGFVPGTGTVVGSTVTGLTGRIGGAVGVKVNGIPATVSDGSFCATVELPAEGPNEITIVCTEAEGNAVGNPASVTLTRATQLPSVTIDAPAEGVATANALVTVTGTAGPGVVEVTVNGRAATIDAGDPNAPRAYSVADLRLVSGLNVLLAKGRTASMKQAAASRRILYLKDAPSVTITSPLSGATIGNASVSISGTYRNLDPSTLAVAGSAASAEVRPRGDSEGSFVFRNVALQPGANALAITGSDALSRLGSASVDVTRDDAAPFIAIADPADHAYFGLAAGAAFPVTGTAIAAPGGTIDVAGAPATIVATEVLSPTRTSYSFSATVQFATLGATPVIARVTEPSGVSNTDAIRVTKLAEAPQVSQTFPENLAVAVDPGAMVVVVFTSPMDRATLASALRLETPAGSPVAGTTRIDRDAITFAPSAPLGAGEYRIRIAPTAADAGGEALGTEFVSTFHVATDAPSTAPVLDALPARVCDSTVTISGTATAGARVRIDLGTLTLTATSDATGRFTIALPLSGPAGYQLVQARTIGANGTLSPAAHACLLTGCGGLEVVSATFDRSVNSLTITFSAEVNASTVTADTIRLRGTDGTPITTSISVLGSAVTVIPAEDLTQRSFTLEITADIRATDGTALRTPYTQSFPFYIDEPPPSDGTGFISGQVLDAGTGRPLAAAAVSVVVPILPSANAEPLTPGPSPRNTTLAQPQSPAGRGESRSDANPAGAGGSLSFSEGTEAQARPPLPGENPVQATAEFRGEGLGVRGLHRAREASVTILTDPRGRYALRLPEGAHTIHVTADGYTEVWRQIVVPAGQGITPIDIRLTKRAAAVEIKGAATLRHGGETTVTSPAILDIPAGGIATDTTLTFTSIGAQSLAGLLPLGWSPIASAEIDEKGAGAGGQGAGVSASNASVVGDKGSGVGGQGAGVSATNSFVVGSKGAGVGGQGAGAPLVATLSFEIDSAAVAAAAQTLSLVRYDSERDEWRVVTPVVTISGNTASSPITSTDAYALVFPDPRPLSSAPSVASALIGIDDPCADQPCTLRAMQFTLDPETVLPTETSIATLTIDGAEPFPSGTAVQAWIDEELRLSDGSVLLDPPFAADLILYRSLDGNQANAVFAIAPTPRAAEVILEVGYDRINVLPYPGRLARGTLVGSEGGRIPGDGSVVVEIPPGATPEPLRASSRSLTSEELGAFAPIAGFRTLAGFSLELQRASDAPLPDIDGDGVPDAAQPELTASARVTFHADPANVPGGAEVIVAEVLNETPYGRVIRLAARATEVTQGGTEAKLFTTRPIDRAVLPLDGVVREGTYLFLAAEQPIAFATGAIRRGATAPYLANALITAPPLGVCDLTRITGLFSIPVLAELATPFTLTPRHITTGEGTPYQAATAPAQNTIVAIGDFILVPQPPQILSTTPAANAVGVPLNTTIRVQFDRALDSSSIAPDAIVVAESNTGARIDGTTTIDGQSAILWTSSLASRLSSPATRHDVTISSRITATTGAPLGAAHSFSFTTIDTLTSTEVHPDRISITIPQNGISTIHGTTGALPTGWQAVAVRRNTDFVVRYQSTAAADGSFSFDVGDCGGFTKGAGGGGQGSYAGHSSVVGEKGAGGRGQEAGRSAAQSFVVGEKGEGGEGRGAGMIGASIVLEKGPGRDSELPGSLRLAEGDRSHRSRVRGVEYPPEGGKLAAGVSGSTGSDVDSIEYRRRSYPRIDEGVPQPPVHRAGIARRSGNLSHPGGAFPLDSARTGERTAGTLLRARSNVVRVTQLASLDAGEASETLTPTLPAPLTLAPFVQNDQLVQQALPAPRPLPPAPFESASGIESQARFAPKAEVLAQALPDPRPLPPVPFESASGITAQAPLAPFASTCGDHVQITDLIDLHILNTNGTLTAILPLPPFVSEDGKSFIASPHTTSTVTTTNGITITVPAGAFDQPTLVTATPRTKDPLAEVPDLDQELAFSTSIELTLDCTIGGAAPSAPCRANGRINLEIPAPNADPTKPHILALLGQSIRGPRLMAVDTLRIENGRFTTATETVQAATTTISQAFPKGAGGRSQGAGEASVDSTTTPPGATTISQAFPKGTGGRSQGAGGGSATPANLASTPAPRPLPPAPFGPDAQTVRSAANVIAPKSTLTQSEVKSHLLGVNRSGIYAVVDVKVPQGSSFGWGVIEGLQAGYDLFWDTLDSLYAAHFYMTEAKGTIAIPILTGVPFKLTGVDAATGLDAFETVYDPIPVLDPGAGFLVDSPLGEQQGPYPVFATPFRIELVEVGSEGIDLEHVRNFTIRLEGGLVTAADSAEPLAADVPVVLFNPSNGALDSTRPDGLVVPGSAGDRIVVVAGAREVDPNAPLSIVFSQPLDFGDADTDDEIDALLRTRFAVHKIVGTSPAEDVTALYRFRADSGGRRVLIDGAASLHRGATYRVLVSKDLAGVSGLKIGEYDDGGGVKGGLAGDLALELTTRTPAGTLGTFEIAAGSIRDLARSGNMVFVSALEGGLRAYDLADSASLKPLAVAESAIDDYWAVGVDAHDRVFATALGGTFGVLRTFRAEDFRQTSPAPQPIASGLVAWAPGYSGMLNLASATVLSDRPEAIPRKLQVLAQDFVVGPMTREAFKDEAGVAVEKTADLDGGFEQLSVTVPWDAQLAYAVQRVTVENLDAALRWSGDAKPELPAMIAGIVARAGDRLVLVRNQRTYAVVSLFGHGVGLFDVNAMESNDASDKPEGYASLRERVLVTSAQLEPETCGHPEKETGAIPDLAFSPEAAILAHDAEAWIRLYALDAGRGVLDLKITPSSAGAPGTPFCGRGPIGMLFRSKGTVPPDDPRLHAMRAKFEALAARPPFGRFNVIATHRWRIEAHDNAPLVPGGKIGSRGTVANAAAQRDYLLVAGNEYGLLITEAPQSGFLGAHHLADVVWIPAGAASVRKVAGSDLAVVVDGAGHLLLVDLARIDERWDAAGVPIPEGALFPTLDASLSANGPYGTGLADPRIVWRSDEPVASGPLAPLVDPATGNVITARLLETTLRSVAAIDPRVRAMIDPDGDGALRETTGVVPLGIRP